MDNPKRNINVIVRLAADIADIARYGTEARPGGSGSGDSSWNDPTGNAAMRTGAAREWVDAWNKCRQTLEALSESALRIGPPVAWPMCGKCGFPVIGEERKTHSACIMKAKRKENRGPRSTDYN